MLNKKGSKMKTKLLAVALIGSLLSAPAMAWGDREQGILAGAAGLWLIQRLNQPPVVVQQAPQFPVPQGPMIGQYPTNPYPYILVPQCRQVLTIQMDRYGNEYRVPATICN
jgi:hypothetical protein